MSSPLGGRGLVLAAILASAPLAMTGCGASAGDPSATARAPLGVQSNEPPVQPITLRYAPPPGARYVTRTELEGAAELFGQEMRLDASFGDERVVRERRPDGTTVLATTSRGGRYRVSMGEGAPREEDSAPADAPEVTIVDPRGRTIDDALFAAMPTPDRGRAVGPLLDRMLDALAYPEQPLRPGDHWDASGSERLADLGAVARFTLTQTLVRVEGSGDGALAIVAVRGRIDGGGDGPGVTGSAFVEGAYTVGVADGVVRGMQVRVSGRLSLGGAMGGALGGRRPGGGNAPTERDLLELPFEGTIRYRAE